jgi:site-specific DNA recombinase
VPGGLSYGYAPIAGDRGKRVIVEAEAEIIRRIFEEYVAGRTPRDIACDLNKDGVPPPRGRARNASTINGNMQRGTGILQNELYAGRLVWNKLRMVKDPDSGKRLSRPNPKGEWQTAETPDLAIISGTLFEDAQCRKKARGRTHPNQQRRPRHMLSGLLRCGACGAGMSTNGKDKSDVSGSAAPQQTKTGPVATLRPFTWRQWRMRFSQDCGRKCGTLV